MHSASASTASNGVGCRPWNVNTKSNGATKMARNINERSGALIVASTAITAAASTVTTYFVFDGCANSAPSRTPDAAASRRKDPSRNAPKRTARHSSSGRKRDQVARCEVNASSGTG